MDLPDAEMELLINQSASDEGRLLRRSEMQFVPCYARCLVAILPGTGTRNPSDTSGQREESGTERS
jgi:hypothetical protein